MKKDLLDLVLRFNTGQKVTAILLLMLSEKLANCTEENKAEVENNIFELFESIKGRTGGSSDEARNKE